MQMRYMALIVGISLMTSTSSGSSRQGTPISLERLTFEAKSRFPLQSGEFNRTGILVHESSFAANGVLISESGIYIHHSNSIQVFNRAGQRLSNLIEIKRDILTTFKGDVFEFQLIPDSRDMQILEADIQNETLYFLVGHAPDPIFPRSRAEEDHLFSLDIRTGKITLIDTIPGGDYEISDIAASADGIFLTFPHSNKIESYSELNSPSPAKKLVWNNLQHKSQAPVSISAYHDRLALILDGFLGSKSTSIPHLLVEIDLKTGNEIRATVLPLIDPRKVQIISKDIALVAHSEALTAVHLRTGQMLTLYRGTVLSFAYDEAHEELYLESAGQNMLLRAKLRIPDER